jgi:hypothetical protein
VNQKSASWIPPLSSIGRIDGLRIHKVRTSFTVVEEIKPTDDVAGKRPRAHPILIACNVLLFVSIWDIVLHNQEAIPSASGAIAYIERQEQIQKGYLPISALQNFETMVLCHDGNVARSRKLKRI